MWTATVTMARQPTVQSATFREEFDVGFVYKAHVVRDAVHAHPINRFVWLDVFSAELFDFRDAISNRHMAG